MNSTPFTASQWQELEHQALIFKYMMAGIPVPQELLVPIRRSFEAMASRFYHHPALGYCSLYGKKLDPEPGRCRRTDGKKWRCSKDAYPDSKYCERHMHRGRNRSRKPVETQQTLLSQSHSSSSSTATTTTTLAPSAAAAAASAGSFQGFPISSLAGAATGIRSGLSQLHLETGSYGVATRDFRNPYVTKADADEHSFFSEASGSSKGVAMDSSLDNTWSLMPSQASAFPVPKERNGSLLQSNYPQIDYHLQDLGQVTISSLPKPQQQQQQHSFFGSEFGSTEPVKHGSQSLRPFFDEWPKTRDSWSDLEDDRSNRTSFSTTQLSMSIPRASSDFSTTSSRSPNDN